MAGREEIMQKKTIIMGIVICLLGIGYFLLNKP